MDSQQGEGRREEAQSGGLLQVGVLSHPPPASATHWRPESGG